MRDSQSLLEQMLSFGGKHISIAEVHAMLGTADETRLANFAQCMVQRDAAKAIVELNAAVSDGVDPGQLAEQFLGYLRDVMTVSIGAPPELMRTADVSRAEDFKAIGNAWGLTTLLAAIQLLDETIVKMKHSVQSRILLEVALVQICTLADLQAVADVVQGISQNLNPNALPSRTQVAPLPVADSTKQTQDSDLKKKAPLTQIPETPTEPDSANSDALADTQPTTPELKDDSTQVTQNDVQVPANSDQEFADPASLAQQEPIQQLASVALGLEGLVRQLASLALEVIEQDGESWEIRLAKEAHLTLATFTSPESIRKLTEGLKKSTGRDLRLSFVVTDKPMPHQVQETTADSIQQPKASQPQRIRETMADPLIKRFIEVLGGEVVKVDDP